MSCFNLFLPSFLCGRRCAAARGRVSRNALALLIGAGLLAASGETRAFELSRDAASALPPGFELWRVEPFSPIDRTRGGEPDAARAQSDADLAAPPALAVYTPASALDASVRTRFSLTDGWPSAGVAFRITSPSDYYLVRVSSAEQQLSLLHVTGRATEEIAEVDADIARDHWQTLQVVAHGDSFKILLDDRWVLTGFDYGKAEKGRFGVWSAGQGVARFDQIDIAPLQPAAGFADNDPNAGTSRASSLHR